MRDGWRAFQRSAVSSSVWFVHLKYPWFPFYGNDFLVSTIGLSCEQVGIYIRLLCIQWDNGGLPNDPAKLADMVGSHGLATAVPVHLFGLCQDGLLRNQRLEEIRKERIQYSATQAEKGKKRWKKHAVAQPLLNNGSSPAQQKHEPNVSLSQSPSLVPPIVPQGTDRLELEVQAETESPMFLRLKGCVGGWFRRKPDTPWSDKERKKLREIAKVTTEESLSCLERYYTGNHPVNGDYRRKDVMTLLNNWTGELDRARNWSQKPKF